MPEINKLFNFSIQKRLKLVLFLSLLFILITAGIYSYFYEKSVKAFNHAMQLDLVGSKLVVVQELTLSLPVQLKQMNKSQLKSEQEIFNRKTAAIANNVSRIDTILLANKALTQQWRALNKNISVFIKMANNFFKNGDSLQSPILEQLALELNQDINKLNLKIQSEFKSSYNRLNNERIQPFLISTAITLIMTLILLLFGKSTISRINRFIQMHLEAAKEVEKGNTHFRLPTDTRDELGQLNLSYNHMSDSFNEIKKKLELRNRELDDFTHSVGHDLRAPLRHIKNFTEILVNEKTALNPSQFNELTSDISFSVNHSLQLLNDLLKFSRVGRENLPIETIDTNKVVLQLVKHYRTDYPYAHIEVQSLPQIQAYSSLFTMLVQNLIENAIKYSNKDHCVITITAENLTDYWRFSVADQGIGIEDKEKDLAFVLFQRLDHGVKEIKGSGAGLAICKKIVDAHSGEIKLKNNSPKGTLVEWTIAKSI